MIQLIDSLINETILQLQDINYWKLFFSVYFLSAIARVMGKHVALLENSKALNPITDAFYEGARHGVVQTWVCEDSTSVTARYSHMHALRIAKETKQQCWVMQ